MLIKVGCMGVDLSFLHPKIWDAIKIERKVWPEEELVITSTSEGVHLDFSKHYQHKAIDKRYRNIDPQKVAEFRELLGPGYDVIVGKGYIHIEWDP